MKSPRRADPELEAVAQEIETRDAFEVPPTIPRTSRRLEDRPEIRAAAEDLAHDICAKWVTGGPADMIRHVEQCRTYWKVRKHAEVVVRLARRIARSRVRSGETVGIAEEALAEEGPTVGKREKIRAIVREALQEDPDLTAAELYERLPPTTRSGLKQRSFATYYLPPIRRELEEDGESTEEAEPMEVAPPEEPVDSESAPESTPAPQRTERRGIHLTGPDGCLYASELKPGAWLLNLEIRTDLDTVDALWRLIALQLIGAAEELPT